MIDWNKDIEFKGFDPCDLKPTLGLVNEESGFVSIQIEYTSYGEYKNGKELILACNADYFDDICVGLVTGKPLNPFLSKDFTVINAEEKK